MIKIRNGDESEEVKRFVLVGYIKNQSLRAREIRLGECDFYFFLFPSPPLF